MGQLLHSRATTTHRVRAEIQQSKDSLVKLAKKYGINPKTVLKWKKRDTVDDMPMGKKEIKSTVLTAAEEEAIVKFRILTQLPLDDVFVALKEEIPKLTRSSLHRCLKRHGVSVLPKEKDEKEKKQEFKKYEIGYLHIDTAELRCKEGKLYLFVAIDRTSKFAVAKIYKNKTKSISLEFLKHTLKTVPYVVHTILTDNGPEYTDVITNKGKPSKMHEFDRLCTENNIKHKLTKIKHPWTNGQVERMNRTIKEATVKKYHYETMSEMQKHLDAYLVAYNCAKHLRSIKFKTPLEFLMDKYLNKPILFKNNPYQYSPGPYN